MVDFDVMNVFGLVFGVVGPSLFVIVVLKEKSLKCWWENWFYAE